MVEKGGSPTPETSLFCGEINGLRIDNFFDLTPPLRFLVKKKKKKIQPNSITTTTTSTQSGVRMA
jgi:hypothetical protein